MFRHLLFFVAFFSLSVAYSHDYYVSIAEIEYNEKGVFEVSIKFIDHDLENALEYAGIEKLFLGTEKENADSDKLIWKYISDRFKIKREDEEIPFTWVGKEITEDGFIYCYLESKKIKRIKNIEIQNTLLTKKYPKQSNIIYLKIANQKYNDTLTKEKDNVIFEVK